MTILVLTLKRYTTLSGYSLHPSPFLLSSYNVLLEPFTGVGAGRAGASSCQYMLGGKQKKKVLMKSPWEIIKSQQVLEQSSAYYYQTKFWKPSMKWVYSIHRYDHVPVVAQLSSNNTFNCIN
jgi:hypothetical protein